MHDFVQILQKKEKKFILLHSPPLRCTSTIFLVLQRLTYNLKKWLENIESGIPYGSYCLKQAEGSGLG